jgi:hypothetical protein
MTKRVNALSVFGYERHVKKRCGSSSTILRADLFTAKSSQDPHVL